MTSDVCEDLGLQAELADSFPVSAGLLGCGRTGELDVVGAKLVQRLCDFNLLGGVKVGICKSEGESQQ